MSQLSEEEIKKKKNKRELIFTLFMLFFIGAVSAVYVITFRYKMQKYQYTPEQMKEMDAKDAQENKMESEEAIHPKPQSFLIESTKQGLVQADVRIPVDIKISPVFHCTFLTASLRTRGSVVIYGAQSRQYTGCSNIVFNSEILVPYQKNGLVIVDVAYQSGAEKYSGAVSIPFQTVTTSSQKNNFPSQNLKERKLLIVDVK
ncbi:MAG: hypothetical protein OEV66_10480 [Spirochaetia bacterium]|nr:hypothetical protein [Spirochaetia bacterium]